MSNTKLVVLIVTAVLVVCLLGVGVILLIGFDGSIQGRLSGGVGVSIDEAQDLDMTGVETVNVNCVLGQIIVAPGEARAELVGNVMTSAAKDHYLVVEQSGSTLNVRFDANTQFPAFINGDVTLRVWLPENLTVNLDVSGASAGIDASGMRFHNAKLHSVSGAVSLQGCAGGALDVGTVSGSVKIDDADFAHVDIKSVSGGMAVSGITGNVQIGNTSGAVRVEQVAGSVKVDNTSGSVSVVQPHQQLEAVSISTISGGVDLKLHPDAAFALAVKSTSGRATTDFDVTVSGSLKNSVVGSNLQGSVNGGGVGVSITTVSGGIRVNKY